MRRHTHPIPSQFIVAGCPGCGDVLREYSDDQQRLARVKNAAHRLVLLDLIPMQEVEDVMVCGNCRNQPHDPCHNDECDCSCLATTRSTPHLDALYPPKNWMNSEGSFDNDGNWVSD